MPAGLLDQILGPLGALAIAVLGLIVLGRDHLRQDAADRKQRDAALEGWREQTAANNRLAAAWEERNRREAERRRRNDP